MPPDDELTEGLIKEYEQVREYFIINPDPECIPLFLNSFGEGDGFSVYKLVDEVLWKFKPAEVIPHLLLALQSEYSSVRYWCTQIAALFPEPDLFEPLRHILFNADADTRAAAVTALVLMKDARVDIIFQQALQQEKDDDVRELLIDALTLRKEKRERGE